MALALMAAGVCMVIWPAWVALQDRDEGDRRPVTAGEIWTMRLVGAALVAGGGYALYAILWGMPGAEFSGV
jgi:hypothetical protein